VVALGLIISKEGVVAVDAKHFNSETDYVARLADGKMYPLTPLTKIKDEQTGGEQVALFNIAPPEGVVALEPSFTPAVLADSDKIKLGQTVVFIGGDETNTVATGLVSNIQYEKIVPKDASTTPIVSKKVAAISTSGEVASKTGGVLVNLSSEVVALGLVRDSIHFLPSNSLSTLLVEYLASSTPEKATAAVSP
jgi:S1-C subfamily serine protease